MSEEAEFIEIEDLSKPMIALAYQVINTSDQMTVNITVVADNVSEAYQTVNKLVDEIIISKLGYKKAKRKRNEDSYRR